MASDDVVFTTRVPPEVKSGNSRPPQSVVPDRIPPHGGSDT
jgi:hypothetical protein